MTAPMTLRNVMGCLKIQRDGNKIIIGVSAISVEAMPAAVYCNAIKENPTPTNGPENTATSMAVSPRQSCMLPARRDASPRNSSQIEKQANPATHRIMFEPKGK